MGRPLDEDMVINIIKNKDYYMTWADRAMLIEEIKDLPSAQPEQKKGEWVLGFNSRYLEKYYYCSNCRKRKYEEHKPLDNFCSDCGADMRKI